MIHIEMYISYHPIYNYPVPDNHRFPMRKCVLLPQRLLHKGIIDPIDSRIPSKVSLETLCLVYTPDYVHKLVHLRLSYKETLPIDPAQNQQLVDCELTLVQGTIKVTLWVLCTAEAGFNIVGGTHRAFSDRGEGFCMLNDQAVVAAYLLAHTAVRKVPITDLDVHQGNGTAEISGHDSRAFTFLMHTEGSYPLIKEQSDRGITLPTGTADAAYPSVLTSVLPEIITAYQSGFMFCQSGVDVPSNDKFGKLSLSVQGCVDRDRFVFSLRR